MSSSEVPEPWAKAMIAAGLVDPRYSREVPSRSRLAVAADTTTSTISAMIAGERDTDGKILERVAAALRVDPQTVFGWANRIRTEGAPFEPHRDADLLTAEEQEAVNELIRLLALPKKQGGERGGDTPATKEAGDDLAERRRRQSVPIAARRTGKPTAAQKKAAEDAARGDDFEGR